MGNLTTLTLSERHELGATGDEATGSEGAVSGTRGSLRSKADARTDGEGGRVDTVSHGEGRESFDGEVGSFGARSDEGGGEGEDVTRTEGDVEASGNRGGGTEDTDGGLVTSLDGQDGTSSAEEGRVGKQRSGTEVGGDTDGLKDASGGDHAGGVSEAEVVLARTDGGDAVLGEGGLEEGDMLLLGLADLLEVGDGLGVETEGSEVRVGELLEASAVEGLLEVLESKSAGDV
jgi:hypothetical protein